MVARIIAAALLLSGLAAPCRANQVFPYEYYKLDNPNCAADNVISGIDNLGQVVGYGCNPARAFSSSYPGYAGWNNISYPGASSSQVFAIDNAENKSGEYIVGSQAFGYIRERGNQYPSFPYPIFDAAAILCGPDGGKHCHGVKRHTRSDLFAVGGNGLTGFKLDVVTGQWSYLSVPGSSYTVATGFNELGDICGNYDGGIWLLQLHSTTFTKYNYPGSQKTVAFHLNWQKQIVGYYVGDDGLNHGFILTYPDSHNPVWQTIDVPKSWGAIGTVVMGNNDHGEIVGYWLDSAGNPHGFLGLRVKAKSA